MDGARKRLKVVHAPSVLTFLDPTRTLPIENTSMLEEAMNAVETFTCRDVKRAGNYFERRGKWKYLSRYWPDEDHCVLYDDGLFSLYLKTTREERGNKVAVYDSLTDNHKVVGYLPLDYLRRSGRHKYNAVSEGVVGVIDGSFTDDRTFAVVLQRTKHHFMTVGVFDIVNATCLLTTKCSSFGFQDSPILWGQHLVDLAVNPRPIAQGQYRIAVLFRYHPLEGAERMEIKLWDPVSHDQRVLKVKKFSSDDCSHSYFDASPESSCKFSPDGRFLCILGVCHDFYDACLLLDSMLLQPLYLLPYDLHPVQYRPMCNAFPTFSSCGSKLVLFNWSYSPIRVDLPQLMFFEVPSKKIQSLQELCRYSILSLVLDKSKLRQLPLSNNLINYLTADLHYVTKIPGKFDI